MEEIRYYIWNKRFINENVENGFLGSWEFWRLYSYGGRGGNKWIYFDKYNKI